MNEEMKIIIKAVTDSAKKGIKDIKKELEGVGKTSQTASQKIGAAFKGIAKSAAIVIGAIAAIGTALVALGKSALQFNKEQAKLNTAFQAAGSTGKQAAQTYKELYRFLGDSGKATEAAAHLAKITTNQKDLAQWSKIAQGVYATFGDSLPIEGLTEAANETLRVGKVTGTLADALNWAGVSEDAMNAKLATTNSLAEREAMLRETLNGLYNEAAEIYEKNNKALLDYNESQAQLDMAMGAAGAAVLPLMTALNNLGSAFFTALKPALDVIIPILATFVNWITKGIQAVTSFFSAITGSSTSIKAFGAIGKSATQAVSSGLGGTEKAAGGAEKAAGGAKKAIEDVKKSTQGFDELNIVSSGKSSSGGSGGGSSDPAYASGGGGGGLIDNAEFGTEVEESTNTGNSLLDRFKKIGEELKDVFAPAISAWGSAFDTVKQSWENAIPSFQKGLQGFKNGFLEVGTYLVNTFVPDVVNSFSVNLAPVIGDTLGFAIEELGKNFEFMGQMFDKVSTDIVVPALESIKTVATDTFDAIGKAWDKHGTPLLDKIGKAFENIRKTLDSFYKNAVKPLWDKLKGVFDDVWKKGLKPVVEKVVDAALEIGECLLQLYNDFISPIVEWIVENIVPIIVKHMEKIIEVIGNILKAVMKVVGGVIDFFKGLIQFITGVFTGDWSKAWEGIKNMFSGIWDVITGIFSTAWETIKGIFSIAGSWFSTVWESIAKVFSGVAGWFKGIFSSAWEGIKNAFSAAGNWFADIWESIAKVFSGVAEWFKGIFSSAWEGIKNAFSVAGNWFAGIWESIARVFSGASEWFRGIFSSAWEGIKGAFSVASSWFSGIWENIKGVFSGVAGWFKGIFSSAWEGIKGVFSTVGSFFGGLWDTIKSKFSSLGSSIASAISDAVKSGINGVINMIQNTINKGIKLINGAIKLINKLPGVKVSTIKELSLPRLAKGGVVDSATVAMIGEAGKEAVLPLENNTQWMDKLADMLTSKMGNTQPQKIVLQVGEKELGWATIGAINGITKQTGGLQLEW